MGQMDIFKSIITKCCVRQIILASYFSRLMYVPRRYHCIPMIVLSTAGSRALLPPLERGL